MQNKPNIVFVITDDHGYGDVGCHGNPVIKTPHIDKLYEESIRFTDFHVGPTCAPTRAGIMTGRYHNSTGVWHTLGGRSLLRRTEVTLADVFKANGYKTGLFGKWHLGDNYPYRPYDRGFEEAVFHGGGGVGQTPDYWGNDYFDDTYFDKGKPRKFEGYCTDVWFSLGMDFIERNKNNPFFCYIATNAPHTPLQVEDKYIDMYRDKVPEHRARYYGMITNIDENIGKLRKRLDELGLAENTIFIFMTDNGTASGCETDSQGFVVSGYNAGMRGIKCSPYEGGHRVIFFLHWPKGGYVHGNDVDELTAYIDFMPTLIELCGLDVPIKLDLHGRSLVPLMNGHNDKWEERTVITDSQRVLNPIKWKDSAVMRGKLRLVNGRELYDIRKDPEQRQDISARYPSIVEELRRDYEIWWDMVSARFGEEIPIVIGSEHEKMSVLTIHDVRGDMDQCAWNQGEIRKGKICNSYWEVEIARDGIYSFELRRWPREADMKITEGIPGEIKDWFSGGVAIPVTRARIRIGDYEASRDISGDEKGVIFEVSLKKGLTHLQTWFEDAEGNERGAYYVYVLPLTLV